MVIGLVLEQADGAWTAQPFLREKVGSLRGKAGARPRAPKRALSSSQDVPGLKQNKKQKAQLVS